MGCSSGVRMDDITTLLILLIASIILGVVSYYELKFIRRKRREKAEAQAKIDDIYNQIITSQAVARALKAKGHRTKDADLALIEAEAAYGRNSYTEAKSALDRAKSLLEKAKMEEEPLAQLIPLEPAGASDIAGNNAPEDLEVPFQEVKKLPKNYMESKFMISAVWDVIQTAQGSGKDTSTAKENLEAANAAFDQENYTEALKYALRAKRSMETTEEKPAVNETKVKAQEGTEKIPPTVIVKANTSKCASCGAELAGDDLFCAICGKKVERRILCPSCSVEVKPTDAFCRKCGMPLRSE